jgi:hypothetical protein
MTHPVTRNIVSGWRRCPSSGSAPPPARWRFDTPTLVRFALFLLIPLGSWLGGAVVERVVDLVLD